MKSDGINQPARFSGGRLLAAGAVLLMLSSALLPLFGAWPETWFWVLAATALGAAILGGFVLPQGNTLAFVFLWAAFGMAVALGTVGIFSIGLLYLIAAIFLLFAIFAARKALTPTVTQRVSGRHPLPGYPGRERGS